MKIEDIEKEGKIYIENLLDYHIDYTIINNEEDNYEAGREHALSEFGADIFKAGAEWMKKYFSWVSVEERLPEEGQRILVGFLFYYKYYDREAQSRRYIDTFTYKDGVWVSDNWEPYPGKELTRRDIKVICWQPIPSFDEILEANRDVLERIKEKGD